MNDLPVGRSVDETLRLVQAFQYTDQHGEVCPAGWKPGADTIIPNPDDKLSDWSKHSSTPINTARFVRPVGSRVPTPSFPTQMTNSSISAKSTDFFFTGSRLQSLLRNRPCQTKIA